MLHRLFAGKQPANIRSHLSANSMLRLRAELPNRPKAFRNLAQFGGLCSREPQGLPRVNPTHLNCWDLRRSQAQVGLARYWSVSSKVTQLTRGNELQVIFEKHVN